MALMAVVLISACLGAPEVYKIKFAGLDVNFRADLNNAEKVSLEPGAEAVRQIMFENPVSIVRIAFAPNDDFNGFYRVAGFELATKTILAYKQFIFTDKSFSQQEGDVSCVIFEKSFSGGVAAQRKICFETVSLNSTEEAFAMANETAPILLMEAGANETKVLVDRNVVRMTGKDMTESGRKYTDLDLAVDKFLLVLLNESAKRA